MRELQLPPDFEEFTESRKKAFIQMKELKESGRRIVGVFCTFTPWEIVEAADAVAINLCGVGDDNAKYAEKRLPQNLCPLLKASYGGALHDRCPFFYFSDMVLAETTCDGKKKMYELLGELRHCHIMQLPPGRYGKGALEFWEKEVQDVREDLEQFYGITITDDDIRRAIKLRNRERKAILDFYEVGQLKPTPLSGYEITTVVSSNDYQFDLEKKIEYLQNRTAELKDLYEKEFKGKPSRPRILVTGCPTTGVMDKVVRRIEELGAAVTPTSSYPGATLTTKLTCPSPPQSINPVSPFRGWTRVGFSSHAPVNDFVSYTVTDAPSSREIVTFRSVCPQTTHAPS